MSFNGTNDFLPFDGSFMANSDYTVAAAVARTSGNSVNCYLGGSSNATNTNLHLCWRSDTALTHDQFGNGYDAPVPGYTTPAATVIVSRHSGSNGKATSADGSQLGSSVNTAPLASWAGAAMGRSETAYFRGQIGEVVISTTALSTADRQRLEGYLAHKWGTPLPAGHPYATTRPVVLPAQAPTGVTALTESTTMQVSWAAPADTGGSPVTDYRVQYRVVGAPSWSSAVRPVSTDTTTMITGLVGGTTYETRVAAVTANGPGAWSTHTRSSPGRAWTPADLAGGTALWFDADDAGAVSTTGGLVATWTDKSGLGRHATGTGTARPTLSANTMNGRPAVVFDGTDDQLPFDGSFLAGTDYTVAAAAARTDARTQNYYLGGYSGGLNSNLHLGWRSNTTITHAQWGNDYDTPVPGFSTVTPTVVLNTHAAATGKATYLDGTPAGTSGNTDPLSSWSDAAVGRYQPDFFAGQVGEIVITRSALNATERQRLEGYLKAKWGTPLPAGHPYATARPLTP